MKERNIFLTSVIATSLAISSFKIYNKSGQIDKDALQGFTNLVSESFDEVEKLIIKKTDDQVNQCECNGAKIIVHGDGHKTPCPCTGTSSGCKCVSNQSQAIQQEKFVNVFTRPNCVYCDKWKNEQKQKFEDSGWTVKEGYGEGAVPFFEFVKGDKKTVKVGFTTLEEAEKLINE